MNSSVSFDSNVTVGISSTPLEQICVSGNYHVHSDISAHDWLLLLTSSPCLVDIFLQNIGSNLSDLVFQKTIQQHGLPDLECLYLNECDNVTKATIDLLLASGTRLRKLYVNGPQLNTKEKMTEWRALIKQNNWELDLN